MRKPGKLRVDEVWAQSNVDFFKFRRWLGQWQTRFSNPWPMITFPAASTFLSILCWILMESLHGTFEGRPRFLKQSWRINHKFLSPIPEPQCQLVWLLLLGLLVKPNKNHWPKNLGWIEESDFSVWHNFFFVFSDFTFHGVNCFDFSKWKVTSYPITGHLLRDIYHSTSTYVSSQMVSDVIPITGHLPIAQPQRKDYVKINGPHYGVRYGAKIQT